MRNIPALVLSCLVLAAAACGGPDGQSPNLESSPSEAPADSDESFVRTADLTLRGYTEADFPRVQELAEGVYSYEELRSAGDVRFTTVSLFIVTSEGVVVADGQGSPEATREMIDRIAEITDQPITHVVICSDHGDHTAGNVAFAEGTEFIADPTSAATLAASAANPNRPEDAPPIVLPTQIVEGRGVLVRGGREIQILSLGRAHTGGDLHVYLPEEKILFMSEAYLNRVFPAMRSAYPAEWVSAIERAQAMDVEVYVPGHGFVESPTALEEELDNYKQALVTVIDEVTDLHDQGLTVEQAVEQADFGQVGNWTLHDNQRGIAVRRMYLHLNGELP